MSKRSSTLPTPLAVELRPSRSLAALQVVTTLLVVLAIARSGAPLLLQLLLVLSSLPLLLLSLRSQGLLGGRTPCRSLRWESERWLWIGADGRSTALRLHRAVVWRQLVVMHFRASHGGGRRSLCLLPDSAEADALRRLRLCLRNLPVYEATADDASVPPR